MRTILVVDDKEVMRSFISKPFSMQGLNDKVRQVLEQSSPFARPARPS